MDDSSSNSNSADSSTHKPSGSSAKIRNRQRRKSLAMARYGEAPNVETRSHHVGGDPEYFGCERKVQGKRCMSRVSCQINGYYYCQQCAGEFAVARVVARARRRQQRSQPIGE